MADHGFVSNSRKATREDQAMKTPKEMIAEARALVPEEDPRSLLAPHRGG
jgi:hypothetical protein